MKRRNVLRIDHQHPRTTAQQVDLHGVDARGLLIFTRFQKKLLALTRALVSRTEHLDRRYYPVARLDVNDFDITLGHRLDLEMNQNRHVANGIAVDGIFRGGMLGNRGCGAGAWPEPRSFD
jgi:hypothetical protein